MTVFDEDGKVYALNTGEPVSSFSPWPAPSEEGGGGAIPCCYEVVFEDRSVLKKKKHYECLSGLIKTIPESSAIQQPL